MDDDAIIALFFERSERAVPELAQKYGRACERLSRNILRDRRDAEECVNDAYLGMWNSIPPQRPSPLAAYLCRVVRNLAVKRYRANTAAKRDSRYDVALEELEGCLPSRDSAEDAAAADRLAEAFNGFLGTLDRENRVLFVRRYWFSDSLRDLAREFGMTEHNASVRLARIRVKLKGYLETEGVLS